MRPAMLALIALMACQRPRAYVICHNANCVTSDPDLDDTPETLERSLALRWNGRPLIDGIEVDTVWDSGRARCAFAHDAAAAATAISGQDTAAILAQHLIDTAAEVGGRRFHLKLDIKPYAGPAGIPLDDDQVTGQAECALDMAGLVAAAAVQSGRRLTVMFNADDPALLQRIVDLPRFSKLGDGDAIRTALELPIVARLPDGRLPDVVSFAAHDVTPDSAAQLAELHSRGIDVMLWMLDADPSVFDAIEDVEPEFVATNEAAVLREWLGPPPDDD